jgi:hypothetical protein
MQQQTILWNIRLARNYLLEARFIFIPIRLIRIIHMICIQCDVIRTLDFTKRDLTLPSGSQNFAEGHVKLIYSYCI